MTDVPHHEIHLTISVFASCVQLSELKDELQPLVQMVKDGKIPPGKVSPFEETDFYSYFYNRVFLSERLYGTSY